MELLTPKQLEIKEREDRILEISRRLILAEGYHGLNMDRIADEIGASKGTVYNHFGCKEEIIISLAVQTMEKRVALFQRAAQFKGPSRHRMFAIGRTVGWVAHWRQMITDPHGRISRPRQVYSGPTKRDYVPVDKR